MAIVLQHKVVASLPSPLEPDSIYYVRVGQGFDIYVTNGSGVVVDYKLNAQVEIDNLPEWSTAETADEALTALGMSASGKTVATGTPAQGRAALGLGTAATRDAAGSGSLMPVGYGGWMSDSAAVIEGYPASREESITRAFRSFTESNGVAPYAASLHLAVSNSWGRVRIGHAFRRAWVQGGYFDNTTRLPAFEWTAELYHTGNATVDSNGFIKNASPIIKLHSDRVETEAPAEFERLDTGHYRITGCNGLRLNDGWYIETPHDRNKVPYFNVEWEQDHEPEADAGVLEEPADVTLTIRCYERVWNATTGQFDNGDPVDIPEGRWIDLRMNEVRQPEPEEMAEVPEAPQQPTEPAEPVIPSVVTMAQAKLALLYAGLYEQVEQALADLPEPQKTAAQIEWNHRQTLEREHPLVAQVATALGLTEDQLDELFVDAAGR